MNCKLNVFFDYLFCLLFLFFSPKISAKKIYHPNNADPANELWRWKFYPELKGRGIWWVSEGKDGTMLFAVRDKIYYYDGSNWGFYIFEDSISGIKKTKVTTPVFTFHNNNFYVGDSLGFWKFVNDKWRRVFPPNSGYHSGVHWFLQTSNNALWVGMDDGALFVKDSNYILYTSEKIKKSLQGKGSFREVKLFPKLPENIDIESTNVTMFEVENDIWFFFTVVPDKHFFLRCKNFSKNSENERAWSLVTAKDGLELGYSTRIFKAQDGTIWFYSAEPGKGIYTYDKERNTFSRVKGLGKFDLTYRTYSITQSNDGAIWIGDWGKVLKFNKGKWKVYTSEEIPIPETDIAILPTTDGNIWLCAIKESVFKIDYTSKNWLTYNGLNFQCETNDGKKWFLTPEGYAVSKKGDEWLQYRTADGLIETPVVLKVSKNGKLWAAGSHRGVAATAYFENERWIRQLHPDLSWGVGYLAVCDLLDGSMLFGSGTEFSGYEGGIKHFRISDGKEEWYHYSYPRELTNRVNYSIDQTPDGIIWSGGMSLSRFDGNKSYIIQNPQELSKSWVSYIYATPQNQLWVSKHGEGLYLFDGNEWTNYTIENGLNSNTISSILNWEGHILASSDRGVSAFDGHSWSENMFSKHFSIPLEGGILKKDSEGYLWINLSSREWYFRGLSGKSFQTSSSPGFKTIRYKKDNLAPDTKISFGLERVGVEGNTYIAWEGKDLWNTTPAKELDFSYRLNDDQWAEFSKENRKQFLGLENGNYRFKVRARDTDFNIDSTPAILNFTVMAPFWKQPWFILLIGGLMGLIVFQTMRVFKRDKQLLESNEQLKEKTKQIENSRRELESFAYSVSHDLRAPLRAIDGFSHALLEDYGNKFNKEGTHFLERIRAGSQQMGQLIDDLLSLSRTTRKKMNWEAVNLSELSKETADELKEMDPKRQVEFIIRDGQKVKGDSQLLSIVIKNLMENAWKFTRECKKARIEFGVEEKEGKKTYYISDNGVGFDMDYADKLFKPFQRLHSSDDFSGTGIGLANVRRVIEKHSGEIWAKSDGEGKGAVFYFRLWTK